MPNSKNLTKEKNIQFDSISFPKYLQNEWAQLFSKHLYSIGKDILHKDNLLLQYDFTRQRPPNLDKGSSQYSFSDKTNQIILWGFGMICATKNDGLFLNRQTFEPKLLKINSLLSNLWEPAQIQQFTIPKTKKETLVMLQLLIKSMKWLENYEIWVLARCGPSYRNKSLEDTISRNAPPICLDKKMA